MCCIIVQYCIKEIKIKKLNSTSKTVSDVYDMYMLK